MQDWQQQSYLASCLQSLDKSKLHQLEEFTLCRSIFLYLIHRHGNTTIYFLRQKYIFNPYFTSWLLSSKQLADLLEQNTFVTDFLSLNSQQCFQEPFGTISKTKTPPKQTKNQPRPKHAPSPKTKTCNTSCYYLSSLKTSVKKGEGGTWVKSSSMQTGKRQKKSILRISQLEKISRLSRPHGSISSSLCHTISPACAYYQVWQPPQL